MRSSLFEIKKDFAHMKKMKMLLKNTILEMLMICSCDVLMLIFDKKILFKKAKLSSKPAAHLINVVKKIRCI